MDTYKRYTSKFQDERTNSEERRMFEQQVLEDFIKLYSIETNLNVKVDRKLFEDLLNTIGVTLQKFAKQVSLNTQQYPELNQILSDHPVPDSVKDIMTNDFRIFCLSLNALKQWLSAEQASMDRVLLGGEFKKKLKKKFNSCILTNETLLYDVKGQVNFHHTMRDGRFPIPLSKGGHDKLEGQD
jgi:hypothetical protein